MQRDQAYSIAENEISEIRDFLEKKVRESDADGLTRKIRVLLGSLKPETRRKAIKFISALREIDVVTQRARIALKELQSSIDMDLRRGQIIRQEEYERHEKARNLNLKFMNDKIKLLRERKAKLLAESNTIKSNH